MDCELSGRRREGGVFAGLDEDSFDCDKRKMIKALIKKNRVDLVCL